MDFEYGVIGGGPAGYTAAMNLAKQGHSVVLFEKDKLGGTCMNKGCIPTKSLLHSSEVFANLKKAEEFGITSDISQFDFAKVAEKKDKTIEKIRKSLELAPPSTFSFSRESSASARMAVSTSIVWNAIDSMIARIKCSF